MMLARLRSLVNSLRRREKMEEQMSKELESHIQMRADDLMGRGGISRGDAVRQARIEFGSVEKYKEQGRHSRGLKFVDEVRSDLRYACRTLTKSKGFAAAAIVTLAIGIGANTAVFSIVDAMLIKALPVKNPEQLVAFDWLRTNDSMIAGYSGSGRPGPQPGTQVRTSFSYVVFQRFHERNRTLTDVFAFAPARSLNVVADGEAETVNTQFVTGEYFKGLGVSAFRGRIITSADDREGNAPVAVISYRYWQKRFRRDPAVLGKTIQVNRIPVAVVGVTPEEFYGTRVTEWVDLTLPLAASAPVAGDGRPTPASLWWVEMMARLKPGITREQVLADVKAGFDDAVRESWNSRTVPTPDETRTGIPELRVNPGSHGTRGPADDEVQALQIAFVGVGAILLIGCVNLANLLLGRASVRRQEISLRLTLGASRGRIIRQLLTESAALAMSGASIGAVLAYWGKDLLISLPVDTPAVRTVIDLRVLAFTASLALITAIAFGLGPALRATRTELAPALNSSSQKGGANRELVRKSIIVAQVAVCLVLLVGAGLCVATLRNFSRVDPGFNPDNLLVFRLSPDRRNQNDAAIVRAYEDMIAAIEGVAGVQAATLSSLPVLAHSEWSENVLADGASTPQEAYIQSVRWNFFETMQMPILIGRNLAPADTKETRRVAIINETMARQIFNVANPTGRSFHFMNGPDKNKAIEVVGIVQDSKYSRLDQPAPATFYMPYTQLPTGPMTFEVRTATDALSAASAVRDAVRRVEPNIPLSRVMTQRRQIAQTLDIQRVVAVLTTVCGTIGLLLACVGLYGIVSFSVARRTNEIGIRIALGAKGSDVLRLILRETIVVVLIGAVAGLAAALTAARFIKDILFGVSAADPVVIAIAVLLLLATAALAGYLPARRASQLNPIQALRYE